MCARVCEQPASSVCVCVCAKRRGGAALSFANRRRDKKTLHLRLRWRRRSRRCFTFGFSLSLSPSFSTPPLFAPAATGCFTVSQPASQPASDQQLRLSIFPFLLSNTIVIITHTHTNIHACILSVKSREAPKC